MSKITINGVLNGLKIAIERDCEPGKEAQVAKQLTTELAQAGVQPEPQRVWNSNTNAGGKPKKEFPVVEGEKCPKCQSNLIEKSGQKQDGTVYRGWACEKNTFKNPTCDYYAGKPPKVGYIAKIEKATNSKYLGQLEQEIANAKFLPTDQQELTALIAAKRKALEPVATQPAKPIEQPTKAAQPVKTGEPDKTALINRARKINAQKGYSDKGLENSVKNTYGISLENLGIDALDDLIIRLTEMPAARAS